MTKSQPRVRGIRSMSAGALALVRGGGDDKTKTTDQTYLIIKITDVSVSSTQH